MKIVFEFLVISAILISFGISQDAFATTTTRSEGNYNIEITMDPDPVNPGEDTTFCVKVTRFDGDNNPENDVNAYEDFDVIKVAIGGAVLNPPLTWDAELGCFTGTFTANWNPAPKIPVHVGYSYVDVGPGQSQPPDGVWGPNTPSVPTQEEWELTHKNPFYFATEGPDEPGLNILAIIGGLIVIVILIGIFVIRRR